jgi:hypothetical protein
MRTRCEYYKPYELKENLKYMCITKPSISLIFDKLFSYFEK